MRIILAFISATIAATFALLLMMSRVDAQAERQAQDKDLVPTRLQFSKW